MHKYTELIFKLNKKDFLRLIVAIATLTALLAIFLVYLFFHQKHTLLKELQNAYKQRNEAYQLIEKNNEIQRQKAVVSQLLEKNSDFRLMQFFDTLIDSLRLTQYVENKQLTTTELENNTLTELALEVKIANINMKQAVEFLEKIEENERIYIKKLEIKKAGKLPAVDVDITIATLQLKSE